MSDLMELDLFAPQEAGFRLERFEVYNWGTFDGQVWTLDLCGRNGLLTGDIGSGKSTLVDGLTTLLVAPTRLSYNKAAGADARERSLTSYVLGHYKSERGESATHGRPVALRGPEQYSALIAVFTNAALGQTVSLAMFAWHRDAAGKPERMYVVADRPLSTATDLADFAGSVPALRRRLRESGAAVHDTLPALCRRLPPPDGHPERRGDGPVPPDRVDEVRGQPHRVRPHAHARPHRHGPADHQPDRPRRRPDPGPRRRPGRQGAGRRP